jgi:hypothetical protein
MKRMLLTAALALAGLILAGTARGEDNRPGWWDSTYYPPSYYGKTTGTGNQERTVLLDGRPFTLVLPSQEELDRAPKLQEGAGLTHPLPSRHGKTSGTGYPVPGYTYWR